MSASTQARLVLTTAGSMEEARVLARTLVEERLAACVNLIPQVESIYRWEGRIESGPEVLLVMKTEADRVPALQQRLHALHRYDVPEFLVLPVDAGSERYLAWLHACLIP